MNENNMSAEEVKDELIKSYKSKDESSQKLIDCLKEQIALYKKVHEKDSIIISGLKLQLEAYKAMCLEYQLNKFN